jgi:hypothetical protein
VAVVFIWVLEVAGFYEGSVGRDRVGESLSLVTVQNLKTARYL